MPTEQSRYFAYMLRLWEVKPDGEQTWRASLEEPRTGERRGFASLEMLFDFLREQTHAQSKQQAPDVRVGG